MIEALPCCEPGCTAEVLCPVHQALADLRAQVEALRDSNYDRWDEAIGAVLALLDGAR